MKEIGFYLGWMILALSPLGFKMKDPWGALGLALMGLGVMLTRVKS